MAPLSFRQAYCSLGSQRQATLVQLVQLAIGGVAGRKVVHGLGQLVLAGAWAMPHGLLQQVELVLERVGGHALAICAATVTDSQSHRPGEISACMADASSSKRRISVPSGAALVTATSWVLARAHATRSFQVGSALDVGAGLAVQHDGRGRIGLRELHLLGALGRDGQRATSTSTLLVSKNGMRLGPVTGTMLALTPGSLASSGHVGVVAVGLVLCVGGAVGGKIHQHADGDLTLLLDVGHGLCRGQRRKRREGGARPKAAKVAVAVRRCKEKSSHVSVVGEREQKEKEGCGAWLSARARSALRSCVRPAATAANRSRSTARPRWVNTAAAERWRC